MNLGSLVGQTLDSKYKIERELGRGGMGAVYFATHIGTERPVALKVIVPQFMQKAEFVERFRREARAAGRLRHPNVVDVTDFGFAETLQGRVAYLVMEYLDGCTLGEILEEEKQLPLNFTLDIVEQVCSAIHEAHAQGIIHRDLKPDNIWLEPNQRGGYTVKVLDFGIAKLEEDVSKLSQSNSLSSTINQTQVSANSETVPDNAQTDTIFDNQVGTISLESGTAVFSDEKGTIIKTDETVAEKGTAILQPNELDLNKKDDVDLSEDGTAVFSDKQTQALSTENDGTKLLSNVVNTDKSELSKKSTADLTRVGAVLGTPLYMSPEQCRGEKLTAHSDIYSLAVIVYQMLGGKTPFEGDFTSVMCSHQETEPPPLEAKKIPKKVKQVIHSALSKNIIERPPTAEAFASELRSHSEGFGRLLQKALVIYSEHLPKFLGLALLLTIPHIFLVIVRIGASTLASLELVDLGVANFISGLSSFLDFFVQIFAAAAMVGTVTWLVAYILAFPLKPMSIRSALKVFWQKKRQLFTTVTLSTLLSMVGLVCCVVPGIYFSTIYMLVAPSIMMEGVSGKAAFRRSKELVKRSFLTALTIAILIYVIPGSIITMVGVTVATISKQLNFYEKVENGELKLNKDENGEESFDVNLNPKGVQIKEKETNKENETLSDEEKYAKKLSKTRRETLTQFLLEFLLTPIMTLITSITTVITALMYFKTRQAGGESMQDLLAQFEESENPQSNWQNRIRDRLQQSGRVSSNNLNTKLPK